MSRTMPHVSGVDVLEASALPGLREYALLGRAARPFCRGLRLVEPPSGPPVAETDPATLADYGRWDKSGPAIHSTSLARF